MSASINKVILLGGAAGAGTGDVVGPASATDNAIVRFDGTTGKVVQNSAVTIADTTGSISINGTDTATAVNTGGLRSANFGLSTVSGGASYFGGNLSLIADGTNTRYVALLNSSSSYAGRVVLQAGGGSATFGGAVVAYGHSHATRPGWVTAGISAGSGGKFSVNDSALGEGTDVFTVTGATGAATFSGAVSVASTTPSTGLGTGALQVAGGVYVGAASVFGGLVFPQQATTAGAPAYVKGAIYFDTTLNKLRVGGASAWETITSV